MENIINKEFIDALLKTRNNYTHKGNYGHTLLVCGSEGMVGAAVLAVGGALRSGCGLVSAATITRLGTSVTLLVRHPSAMIVNQKAYNIMLEEGNFDKYTTIGIGCGIGKNVKPFASIENFTKLFSKFQKPMVIDADAINIFALNIDLQELIPKNSVLTPHIAELCRLIGKWQNIEERNAKVKMFAQKYSVVMVIKGYNTMVCNELGECYFNTTGNAFLAKAGSGDVLTGLIAGLIARGYQPFEAAAIGVYFHGLAGEKAEQALGGESYNASDLEKFIRIG